MAQCQARVTKQSVAAQLVTAPSSLNLQIISVLFLLLAMAVSYSGHAHDNELQTTLIARADIGAIENNVANNPAVKQKTWAELTDEQKKVLAPLGAEWDTLRPWQREKMLDIAQDYPRMDVKKQARIQKRLNSWSRMTPYERENARKRYQHFHSLTAQQQDEVRKRWKEHAKQSNQKLDKLEQEYNASDYDPDLD